jgi:hypothetical protein
MPYLTVENSDTHVENVNNLVLYLLAKELIFHKIVYKTIYYLYGTAIAQSSSEANNPLAT